MDDIVEKSLKAIERMFDNTGHRSELKVVLNALYRCSKSQGYSSGYKEGVKDGKAGKDQRVVAHLN